MEIKSGKPAKNESVLEDGSRLRHLDPRELSSWLGIAASLLACSVVDACYADHCALVFKAKGTPRDYFDSHVTNDPTLRWDAFQVAVGDCPNRTCDKA